MGNVFDDLKSEIHGCAANSDDIDIDIDDDKDYDYIDNKDIINNNTKVDSNIHYITESFNLSTSSFRKRALTEITTRSKFAQ